MRPGRTVAYLMLSCNGRDGLGRFPSCIELRAWLGYNGAMNKTSQQSQGGRPKRSGGKKPAGRKRVAETTKPLGPAQSAGKPKTSKPSASARTIRTVGGAKSTKGIRATKVPRPAKSRSASPYHCPIDAKCGGCQWLSVPYAQQLSRKQRYVQELFADLVKPSVIKPIAGMETPLHYRNKVVSPFVGVYDKRAKQQRILCGMYERGTHRVIDSAECLIENELAKRIILSVRDLMVRHRMQPYDEDTDEGFLRHAQVRVGHSSGEVMVTLVKRDEAFPGARNFVRELKARHPEITTVVQNVNTRQTNVIMGETERTLYGPGFILDTLCGLSFRISSKSFYQVNSTQTEVLYTRAIEMAQLTGTETVLDAYCGTGTIGLVAMHGVNGGPGAKRLIGVEERQDAVTDARNNARHNGIENAEFVAGDASAFLRQAAADGLKLDVLFMDPPRAGSTPDFLKAACAIAPKRIVYISCNAKTQARDVRYLLDHGYRIEELQPVDMFPHTDHVETVVLMTRK